jgi:hypothetical protein
MMYQVTGDVTAHYSTISLARTSFSQVLTLSALKVICMTFNITSPNPNHGTSWYIVHTLDLTCRRQIYCFQKLTLFKM